MTTFLTILIFTLATAAAAEISIWGPERRARQEIGNRLRGLRVSAGPRTGSLLRQQQFGTHRLEITKSLQAMIDQARLPYRAGNVLTFSALLLAEATSYPTFFACSRSSFLKYFSLLAARLLPYFYIRMIRNRRMRHIEELPPMRSTSSRERCVRGHNIQSGLAVLADETPEPLGGEFKKLVEDLALGSAGC